MTEGSRVNWSGVMSPWCAPGETGTVLSVSEKDPDQLKVEWDVEAFGYTFTRPRYTFERRRNLVVAS